MEKRVIIGFNARDLFTGCHPNPIEYGMVNNEEAALVAVRPGFVCQSCEAASRCKKNFTIVESRLPSQVSRFSDS